MFKIPENEYFTYIKIFSLQQKTNFKQKKIYISWLKKNLFEIKFF